MPHLDPRFTPSLIALAQASHMKFWPRGPFVSITLAQWADESAYGTRMSGENNCFGIKATRAQISAGKATKVLTKEFIAGQYRREWLYFADFDSLEQCFDAHAKLLTTTHYGICMQARTPEAYAEALHTCGYATEPSYATILMAIIDSNGLTQFDQRF